MAPPPATGVTPVPSKAARPIERVSCLFSLSKGRSTEGEQSPGPNRHAGLPPNLDSVRLIAASVTWVAARIIHSVPRRRDGQPTGNAYVTAGQRAIIKSTSHHWLRGSPGYGLAGS